RRHLRPRQRSGVWCSATAGAWTWRRTRAPSAGPSPWPPCGPAPFPACSPSVLPPCGVLGQATRWSAGAVASTRVDPVVAALSAVRGTGNRRVLPVQAVALVLHEHRPHGVGRLGV